MTMVSAMSFADFLQMRDGKRRRMTCLWFGTVWAFSTIISGLISTTPVFPQGWGWILTSIAYDLSMAIAILLAFSLLRWPAGATLVAAGLYGLLSTGVRPLITWLTHPENLATARWQTFLTDALPLQVGDALLLIGSLVLAFRLLRRDWLAAWIGSITYFMVGMPLELNVIRVLKSSPPWFPTFSYFALHCKDATVFALLLWSGVALLKRISAAKQPHAAGAGTA